MWARPDVAHSPVLWGRVCIIWDHFVLDCPATSLPGDVPAPATFAPSLAAWLARRRRAVRKLYLTGQIGHLDGVLSSLAGGPLAELNLRVSPTNGQQLHPLRNLSSLTRLEASGPPGCAGSLAAVPPEAASLPALQELVLGGNEALGAGGASAFRPLESMPNLTLLDLSATKLRRLPQHVSSLSRLASLCVAFNPSLGSWSKGNFHWVQYLTRLRELNASDCELACIPPQLTALAHSLEALDAGGNRLLGSVGEAFLVLPRLTSLTRLSLNGCDLRRIPDQLAALAALADLDVGCNFVLGCEHGANDGAGASAFGVLPHLTALRRLSLMYIESSRVPEELGALTALASLCLDGNMGLGSAGPEAFTPLLGVRSTLTHLSLGCCSLKSLPPALIALTALREVNLEYNVSLSDLQPLLQLPNMRRAAVGGCDLYSRMATATRAALAEAGVEVAWCLDCAELRGRHAKHDERVQPQGHR